MEVTNAKQAWEWVESWKGCPRFGVLKAAIQGLKMSASLCDRLPTTRAGYVEALGVLTGCLIRCYPERVGEVDCTVPESLRNQPGD